MNAADQGSLQIASVQPARNAVTETAAGKSTFFGWGRKADKMAQARELVDKAAGLIEKDPAEAKSLLQKAVDLDPKSADAYFNLGYVHAVGKNFPKAEEMYSQSVKLSPPYLDEALFNLALVQEKQGKMKQSMESLERALKINPKNEKAPKLLKKIAKDI